MVATITALNGQAVMANWEAAIAVAVALTGLWMARMRMTARKTVPDRRVGYGLARSSRYWQYRVFCPSPPITGDTSRSSGRLSWCWV
ncbi:hypothetical protein AS9A_2320 [Hoyosella subflava DQS3-9A1]|uniref:Uncharacterized protein n=2 Tax=Hoyosella TaxID=697025 RepID=F6ERV2_HOYSD|nr:hypothetical protein AS9A_2320 [Hoyosella subflava DQS3-9A1]